MKIKWVIEGLGLVLAIWATAHAQPVIITQPQDQVGDVGGTSMFSVTATDGQLAYQWQRNGVDVPGATTSTLTLNSLTPNQAGNYTVVVSNLIGSVTSRVATLTLFTRIMEGPIVNDGGDSGCAAWGDYNNDGFIDLFVQNGNVNINTLEPVEAVNYLYRNTGDGTFTRMTGAEVGPIATDADSDWGGAWADFDNDGFLDLFVPGWARREGANIVGRANALYRNLGNGAFARCTDCGPIVTDLKFSGAQAWGDYDNDGWLDLFVADAHAGLWTPYAVQGTNSLYRNNRDGTFSRDDLAGLGGAGLESQGAAGADYDDDGDLDLVVPCGRDSNGIIRIVLFRNEGDGRFTVDSQFPNPQAQGWANDALWFDCDNDGRLDLFVSNGGARWSYLYHNEGGGHFTLGGLPAGGGGVQCADYDNDGDQDLFMVRGEIVPYPSHLYRNNGDGTFTHIETSRLATDTMRSEGCAWGDYNNDGFMDLFVATIVNQNNALYRNEGNGNNWIVFKLIGMASNRSAIGAKVRVEAVLGGKTIWQMRVISSAGWSQSDLRAHFGLRDATEVKTVRVEWPSGIVQEFWQVRTNQFLTVTEPVVTVQPKTVAAWSGDSATLTASWSNAAPSSYQWRLNGHPIVGANQATLELVNLDPSQAGLYSIEMVSEGSERVISQPSTVTLYPLITQQPQSQSVPLGGAATFSVSATSPSPPLTYQWQFNGRPLPSQTNDTLTLTDVQAEQGGLYEVVVTDARGSATSEGALLTVLVLPSVTQIVTNYNVVQGGSVTLSVETSGTLPMGYRWRRNNSTLKHEVLFSHQSFLVLSNVQPSMGGSGNRYSVVLTNAASHTPGVVSPNIYLTVLADSDSDGMPDEWESRYGLNPNDPSDAALDGDGDGQCNCDECATCTDPTDTNSYLKVDRIAVSGEARIEFRAVANTTYTVQYAESLAAPIGWGKLADVVASPESRTVVVTDTGGVAQRYYRLVTPAQP